MDPVIPLVIVAAVGWLAAFFVFQQMKAAKEQLASKGGGGGSVASGTARAVPSLDGKVEELRKELAQAKDELNKKAKLLEEARDQAKKSARKEAQKAERQAEKAEAGTDPRDVEIQGLKRGMASLESQLNQAKRELDGLRTGTASEVDAAKNRIEAAEREKRGEGEKRRTLEEENQHLKRTIDELRLAMKKRSEERPDVPGSALDLKGLPTDVVQELARFFRKGEEFERLYHVAQGQLQLERDRGQDLQRRYFAVCRELAVAAGRAPGDVDDRAARAAAEGVVAQGDRSAPRQPREPGQQQGQQADGVVGPDGVKKKRRRRRRKKTGAPGAPGEAQAAGGEEGSDDGHDEGDEHDDDGHDDGDEGGHEHAADGDSKPTPTGEGGAQAPA